MFNMVDTLFTNDDEVLIKLKSLDILSKTKTVDSLSTLVYKSIDLLGNMSTYHCKVIGFSSKVLPSNCLNKTYENLIIECNDEVININIDYFKEMQKKII